MLKELGVYKLVLPSIPSVLDAWTTSFGFMRTTESERLWFLGYTFLDFQDTIMCHKQLLEESPMEPSLLAGILILTVQNKANQSRPHEFLWLMAESCFFSFHMFQVMCMMLVMTPVRIEKIGMTQKGLLPSL